MLSAGADHHSGADPSVETNELPLIAVTTSSAPAGSHGLLGVHLYLQYVAAVEGPGAVALLVTPGHDDPSLERLIGMAHGLVLTGGEDVDPSHYGQERIPECGATNDARDRMEMLVLQLARARGMPVLAICRGMQLLNVAMGGTLYQDIPAQLGGDVLHEQLAPVDRRWHHATVERGSGLEQIFGARELFINSFHHQAVDRLAEGLRATVTAEDGVVEGVESADGSWLYGVQWHPERGEASLPHDARDPDRRLLWTFVHAAREFAARGTT
jgi:gamma-glutamyl-gamma-aminobutyrate hydrolase PuuD